jgi:hypothetical protein
MRDEDKPYICYHQSWWNMRIVPRNAAGWRGLGLWMLPFFGATAVFSAIVVEMEKKGASDAIIIFAMTVPFVIGTIIWSVAMTRWMKARSQVIKVS